MSFHIDDTIVAVASAPGGARRGIVRASGPDVVDQLSRCFRGRDASDPAAVRVATMLPGTILAPFPLNEVACDLYLWPTIQSFTRQPAVEVHTFGSPPILDGIVQTLRDAGARLAEPGEFTMRAFLAGRLDLTQAEAVLGVIDARDRAQLETALGQLAGGISRPLNQLRNELLDMLAHLEAGLDFVEEDIEFITPADLDRQLAAAISEIDQVVLRLRTRHQATEDPRVVFCGRPNVGKSSLMNALAGPDAALVADQAGTTRDYVTRVCDLEQCRVLLVDTAGLDDGGQVALTLEGAAQARSREQIEQAQVQLFCLDASRPLTTWEMQQLARAPDPQVARIVVLNKTDLPSGSVVHDTFERDVIRTSCQTGMGIPELRDAIRAQLDSRRNTESGMVVCGMVVSTAARCLDSLTGASARLRAGRDAVKLALGEEIVAAEVRLALTELGKVVGAVYTDDILDRVFSRFCIGK